jgi:hypothetical protein
VTGRLGLAERSAAGGVDIERLAEDSGVSRTEIELIVAPRRDEDPDEEDATTPMIRAQLAGAVWEQQRGAR